MQLITFRREDQVRVGVLDSIQQQVIDVCALDGGIPSEMNQFIAQADQALDAAARVVDSGQVRIPLEQVALLAPIPRPRRNIFCIGKNYRAHVQELQASATALGDNQPNGPDKPIFFTKATTTVSGPGDLIPAKLDFTNTTDYEGELGVIIGRGGFGIQPEAAMQHIFGYTIINDVTSRQLQGEHQQWFLGKSLNGYCPMGPVIVTADEITDVQALRVQTWVDGELRQDDRVASMIFDIPHQIATLSRTLTLEAGDIIATGTPAGVGMGFKPPRYLRAGSVVRIQIDPIGALENRVG